jgi:hypothetical protein
MVNGVAAVGRKFKNISKKENLKYKIKIAFLQIQYGSEKDPNKYGGKKFGDNPIKRGDGQ